MRLRHQFVHEEMAASVANEIENPSASGHRPDIKNNFKASCRKLSAYNPGAWDEEFEEALEANDVKKQATKQNRLSAYNPGAWDEEFEEGLQANETFFPSQDENDAVETQVQLVLAKARIAGLEAETRTLRLERKEHNLKCEQFQKQTEYLLGKCIESEAEKQFLQHENQQLREENQAWRDRYAEDERVNDQSTEGENGEDQEWEDENAVDEDVEEST